MSRHTLSVLVEDQPGVLARISALFSRRGFNIDSLAVGPTERPEISRMTIVVSVAGPYRDGTWTRWNIQVSEQNYDCHNSTRTYWTFTDNNGSYVVHYPGHPSLGSSTTYYR